MDLGTLNIGINAKIGAAVADFKKYQKEVDKSKKMMSPFGKVTKQQLTRITLAIGVMTGAFGKVVSFIVSGSPDVAAALIGIELAAFDLQVAMGEHLAPMIENILVPAFEGLVMLFKAMPEPMQQFVVAFFAIGLAVGVATIAIIALYAALVVINPVFFLIIAALALLYVAWDNNFLGMADIIKGFGATFGDTWNQIKAILEPIMPLIKAVGLVIATVFGVAIGLLVIAPLIIMFGLLKLAIDIVLGAIDIFISAIRAIIEQDPMILAEAFGRTGTAIMGTLDWIGDAFRTFWNGIINMFGKYINEMIDIANKVPGVDIGHVKTGESGPTGGTSASSGGYTVSKDEAALLRGTAAEGTRNVPRDMMMYVHRDEEVMRATEARRFRDQRGNGGNGQTTIIYKNSYNVGSILDRRMLDELMVRIERLQKRKSNRRMAV